MNTAFILFKSVLFLKGSILFLILCVYYHVHIKASAHRS